MAEAIVTGIVAKGIELTATEEFEAIPGFGIRTVLEGKILARTRKLMAQYDVSIDTAIEQMEQLEQAGKTPPC